MAAVLIVDDDANIRDVLYELFSEEHVCHTAESAEQALVLLEAGRYDVAIVDISLPLMSGLELLGHIRQRWPGTPVIIITGINYHQYVDNLMQMGASDYLVKPFQVPDIEGKVSQAVMRNEEWLESLKESADRALKSSQHLSSESSTLPLDRRSAVRYGVKRAARLLFAAAPSDVNKRAHDDQPPPIIGHTRDISTTGISLMVPVLRRSDRDLYGSYGRLQLILSLPNGNIEIHADPVRYSWFDESDSSKGYIIGARIIEIDPDDHARFNEYLGTRP